MDQGTKKSIALKRAETVKRQRDARSPLVSMDAASVAWRREQANVDADIEGLARLPETDALIAEMDRENLSPAERRERLTAFYRQKSGSTLAAE